MVYKVKPDFLNSLYSDLDKKFLKSGKRLAGRIKNNKIELYTEDDFGKRSAFLTRVFYGTVKNNVLSGKFRLGNYVLILIWILFAVCVESIVTAAIALRFDTMIIPAAVIICIVLYFALIKKLSAENDKLIQKYLEDCSIEN